MDNVTDPDPTFESLVENLRVHDRERRQELLHLRMQNQMMQSELAKRNATIQTLQAQIHKLTEFKRGILRSVQSDEEFAATTYEQEGSVNRAPSHGVTQQEPQSDASEVVDGREFFVEAQRELTKDVYKSFLSIIAEYNKCGVSSLPYEQANEVKMSTLNKVRQLFGPAHTSLFNRFCILMSRG